MAREIIWADGAKSDLEDILKYWAKRNHSKSFSSKLASAIINRLKLLIVFPESGKKTDLKDVRYVIVKDHLIFYQIKTTQIHIIAVGHGSKNKPRVVPVK